MGNSVLLKIMQFLSKSKSEIAYDIQTEVYVWSNTTAIRESQLLNELKCQEWVKS